MELPSDISYLEIPVPAEPLDLSLRASDPERLQSAAQAITQKLLQAKQPALVVDMDVDR
ncbi:hypothetical protein ACFV2U_24670 [Streptomyces sp. NPDC059697]|uniref:hypothetical protein n=1 Tax=Streptomyces sp. NPDC059697 TaxID=3346912 RepID=UPI0036B44505